MQKIAKISSFVLASLALFVASVLTVPAHAVETVQITEAQKNAVYDHCDKIRENLRTVQRDDAKTRVYLGRYYETILNGFITPLNVRLVENNLTDDDLLNNQSDFARIRTNFTIDFIEYQKVLEDLVGMDCRAEPTAFYVKLSTAREKRAIVAEDVNLLQRAAKTQVRLVTALKGKL